MLNSIQDAVIQLLPARRKSSASGWTSFNAVCCTHNGETADTRGRGGITTNPDGGVSYHCFNCNFKTGFQPGRHLSYKFRKLLSWLGADENTVRRLVIEAVRIKDLVAPEIVAEAEQAEPIDFKPRSLPAEAQTLHALYNFYELKNNNNDVPEEFHRAVLYLGDRGINPVEYEFYWTPETAYNLHRRVIVPFTWQGRVIGYTARATEPGIKPKYHNSHEPGYVFNVDRQQRNWRFVIVCEGPFDAMSIDGVAVLSNTVSEQQADIIDSLGREVIVVPDADRAGRGLVEAAMEYGWSVSFPVWQETHKDINSAVCAYGKLFVLKSILATRQSSRLKIELHAKRLYN